MAKSALEPLLEAPQDDDITVKAAAAVALGLIGDPAAVKPMARLLEDKAPSVRRAAAEGLGEIGPEAKLAVDALFVVMKEPLRPPGRPRRSPWPASASRPSPSWSRP